MKCYAIENYLNADSVEQRETFKLINTQTYARDERTIYSHAGVEWNFSSEATSFSGNRSITRTGKVLLCLHLCSASQ